MFEVFYEETIRESSGLVINMAYKRPKCPRCFEKMYTLQTYHTNSLSLKLGYICKYCNAYIIIRKPNPEGENLLALDKVFIGLKEYLMIK